MRKITQQATAKFLANENFRNSNTEVRVDGDTTRLILFGSTIAKKENDKIFITLAGYNTNTTRERLSGLCRVSTKQGQAFLNGQPIETYKFYEI